MSVLLKYSLQWFPHFVVLVKLHHCREIEAAQAQNIHRNYYLKKKTIKFIIRFNI